MIVGRVSWVIDLLGRFYPERIGRPRLAGRGFLNFPPLAVTKYMAAKAGYDSKLYIYSPERNIRKMEVVLGTSFRQLSQFGACRRRNDARLR